MSEALDPQHTFLQLSNKVIPNEHIQATPQYSHVINIEYLTEKKHTQKLVITEFHLTYQCNLLLEKAAYKISYIFSSFSLCTRNAQCLVGKKTCAIEPSIQINKVMFKNGKNIISSKLKTAAAIKD